MYNFDNEEQTLFARDEPGPPMGPDTADRLLAAVEFFEDNPDARTTITFVHHYEGQTLYNLLGVVLLLDGVDLEIIPRHDRFELGAEILLEELGFSTFDFYAVEEVNGVAEDPTHLRELIEEYIECPMRVPQELRGKRPTSW